MADFDVKIMAEQLGKSIENLVPHVEHELHQAIGNLAHAAHAGMVARIQGMSMDAKNRQDYLRALKIEQISDATYVIFLNGEWPTKLEEGYGPYSIKDQLLSSEKIVQVGSRAGEPWVRKSKRGKKYAAVPFTHKPFSGAGMSGDLSKDIQKILVKNMHGKDQPITKIFKDAEGNPLTGKVAVSSAGIEGQPNLKGLTKYQHVSDKGKVSSIYMTFRIVSEDSSGWTHPGHKGYQLFKEAEEYVQKELENIINTLL